MFHTINNNNKVNTVETYPNNLFLAHQNRCIVQQWIYRRLPNKIINNPVNRINLGACDFEEQLYNNPDFYVGVGSGYPAEGYPIQEYSMGQGSAHGLYHDSVPNDDDDDNDDESTL